MNLHFEYQTILLNLPAAKFQKPNITNICRSLQGGLSRDGREDEAYPLQPYYFLALIPWQYDHLDEEYA